MLKLNWIITLIEVIIYIALPVFISSTIYLIFIVKNKKYKMIKEAVTNPIIPNIDLRFFRKLQNEYMLIRKNKLPALANRVSFVILIMGFIALFILVVLQELIRH